MQLQNELTKGLVIISPFLKEYGFEFEDFQIDKGLDNHLTIATFKNENKKFIIDYRFSIGQVLYQYEKSIVSHPFYLDHLGFADKKLHNDFISDYHLEAFIHILNDFEYLVDDFFKGECYKLKEISKLQHHFITAIDRNIRKENSIQIDKIRIERARQEFRKKEFKNCIEIYSFIDNKELLAELDNKIIEFCKRHF